MRGHVRKRGNKWAFVVEMERDPITNKRQQKWFSGYDSQKEAELALAETITKLNNNTFILPNNTKLGEYLDYWLSTRKNKIAITTYNSYKAIIENHLKPELGGIELQKLRPLHIQSYYTKKEETLSQRTLSHHHGVLSHALKSAVGWQMIPNNPCNHVEPPLPKRGDAKSLTSKETKYLMEFVKDTNMEAPVILTIYTGLRRGELLALKWGDIDFVNKTLSINKSLAIDEDKNELLFKEPKSQSSNRVIALSDQPIAVLKKHKALQGEQRLKLGESYANNNLVFAKEDGEPINPSTFSRQFRKMIKKSQLKSCRFHDLRHTHATMMMNLGVPPKVVSERLGHAKVATTLDTYSHVLEDAQKEAANKMDKFFNASW